jgi:hypothetical protein
MIMPFDSFTWLCLIGGIAFLASMITPAGADVLFNESDNINILSMVRFPTIISGASFALISIVFGFHTDVLTQYDDPNKHMSEVDWTSPRSVLEYPAEQLFLSKNSVRGKACDTITFDRSKALRKGHTYSYLFIMDNTISSNNKFFIDSAKRIANIIKANVLDTFTHDESFKLEIDSLDVRQLIPLYLASDYAKNLTDSLRSKHYLSCINYSGRTNDFCDTLTVSPWLNCKQIFDSGRRKASNDYVQQYINRTCAGLRSAKDSATIRRTDVRDFLDMANLRHDENDPGRVDSVHFGSVIIISDFYHEFKKGDRKEIILNEIESKIIQLIDNPRIKQISLFILPVSSEGSTKQADLQMRDKILQLFEQYGKGNKYGDHKKLYSYDFLNSTDALLRITAAVHLILRLHWERRASLFIILFLLGLGLENVRESYAWHSAIPVSKTTVLYLNSQVSQQIIIQAKI